ncbi:hypothetical protein SDJN03_02458, partial [Cucurbita argyrosperma subsp. sororia]
MRRRLQVECKNSSQNASRNLGSARARVRYCRTQVVAWVGVRFVGCWLVEAWVACVWSWAWTFGSSIRRDGAGRFFAAKAHPRPYTLQMA